MAVNYPRDYEMRPTKIPHMLDQKGQTLKILKVVGVYLDECSKAKKKMTDGLKEILDEKMP